MIKHSDANPTTGRNINHHVTEWAEHHDGRCRSVTSGEFRRLWNDATGNGIQDVGENRSGGVVVMLQDGREIMLDINGNVGCGVRRRMEVWNQFTN